MDEAGSLVDNVHLALKRAKQVHAMRKAFKLVRRRQQLNRDKMANLEERKRRLKETRASSVANEELLNQAIENLRRNGIKLILAKTKEDAVAFVINEVGGEKLVVKSKSNTTKEIDLTGALEEAGIEVVETDIGDRIIQLCGEKPCHPTGPAVHLTSQDIAECLSRHFGTEVEPVPEKLTELIKQDISEYMNKAKIGITGANAITAEEGAVVLLHNEGNIIEVAMRPEKHIIVAGMNKIYPNLEEAINMTKIQTFYATGSLTTSFITILGGPSQTADIEKKLISGIHGPKEVCLILLDNARSQIAGSEFKELLYCIGCGTCLLVCPAYNVYGNEFGVNSDLGGRGVVFSELSEEAGVEVKEGLDLCLTCAKCRQNCPLEIDIPNMITKLRIQRHEELSQPALAKAYDFTASHFKWAWNAIYLEVFFLVSKMLKRWRYEGKTT